MKETPSQRAKFTLIYRLIKENANIPFTPDQFIDKAKVFSIPILNRILLLFVIMKLIVMLFYFISFEKTFINLTIAAGYIQVVLCVIVLYFKQLTQYKIFFFTKVVDSYVAIRILRVIFIMVFFYEENHTIFFYEQLTFQLNPGFIFFMFLSLLFFESSDFSGGLFYVYVVNFVTFVYFCSFQNCMNFYLPINMVIGMFILISVVSHNVGRKLTKSETYFKFYERLLETICKEQDILIAYDNHVIYPREEKIEYISAGENKRKASIKVFDDLMESQSETSFIEQDNLNTVNEKENKIVEVKDFEGFNLVFKSLKDNFNNYFIEKKQEQVNQSGLLGFINLLLYLRNTGEIKPIDLTQTEDYFDSNFKSVKSKMFQNEMNKNYSLIQLRDRIIILLIETIIETVCDQGPKINVDDDCLKSVNITLKDNIRPMISLKFKESLNKKIFLCIKTIIRDVCKPFNYEIIEDNNSNYSIDVLCL